jgi:hypothetical protein
MLKNESITIPSFRSYLTYSHIDCRYVYFLDLQEMLGVIKFENMELKQYQWSLSDR